MAVRKLKPVTPGQRHKIIGTFEDITASVPEKSLVYGKRSTGGRNNTGKMTVRYMGGGHKKKYRLVDFKREKDGVPATVKTIEYDPNRSARIALLYYAVPCWGNIHAVAVQFLPNKEASSKCCDNLND